MVKECIKKFQYKRAIKRDGLTITKIMCVDKRDILFCKNNKEVDSTILFAVGIKYPVYINTQCINTITNEDIKILFKRIEDIDRKEINPKYIKLNLDSRFLYICTKRLNTIKMNMEV